MNASTQKKESMKILFLSNHHSKLLLRLSELETAMGTIKSNLIEGSQSQTKILQDCLDHAVEQKDLDINIDLLERYTKERWKILNALDRIKNGTYGECRECGEMIDSKRLLVHPTASLCMECQNQKEDCKRLDTAFIQKPNPSNFLTSIIFKNAEVA